MKLALPGSRSMTDRALLLGAAARGTTRLRAPLRSEDTLAFRAALAAMGVRVVDHPATGAGPGPGGAAAGSAGSAGSTGPGPGSGPGRGPGGGGPGRGPGGGGPGQGPGGGGPAGPAGVAAAPGVETWEITGLGAGPSGKARVWCADAGTAARFLPPFAAAGTGHFTFDGSEQLRARPLAPLLQALCRIGAAVVPSRPGATLPLTVLADGLDGGDILLESGRSSQYVTGLLLAGPLMRSPLTVRATGSVSRPYIDMTLAMMRRFGARASAQGEVFTALPGGYTGTAITIEPDASAASYFFAAAAVTGGTVTVPGLGYNSLQGDLRFVDGLRRMGARVRVGADATTVTGTGPLRGGFVIDMGDVSDTFMTLAAIAPLADAPVTIHGVGHARLKESDRIAAVARNLHGLGIAADTGRDWITVHPGRPRAARIRCLHDHRIAMAFSVLGLRVPGLTLDDPACVAKAFPGFHAELRRAFPAPAPAPPS